MQAYSSICSIRANRLHHLLSYSATHETSEATWWTTASVVSSPADGPPWRWSSGLEMFLRAGDGPQGWRWTSMEMLLRLQAPSSRSPQRGPSQGGPS